MLLCLVMREVIRNVINHIYLLPVSIVAILAPVEPLCLTTGFLILVDMLFGLWRARKNGEKITSRKMGNTISKIVLYNVMILSVFILNKYIINTGLPLEKFAAGILGLVELKSIDESWVTIYGWSLWDKIKTIINRGKSTTKDLLEDIEKDTK